MTTHKRLKKLQFYSLTSWGTLSQQINEACLNVKLNCEHEDFSKLTLRDGEKTIHDKMKNVYV